MDKLIFSLFRCTAVWASQILISCVNASIEVHSSPDVILLLYRINVDIYDVSHVKNVLSTKAKTWSLLSGAYSSAVVSRTYIQHEQQYFRECHDTIRRLSDQVAASTLINGRRQQAGEHDALPLTLSQLHPQKSGRDDVIKSYFLFQSNLVYFGCN